MNGQINNVIEQQNDQNDIGKIKEWILSFIMNSSETIEVPLMQIRGANLIKKLHQYIVTEYINNDRDLNETFSQFYNNFIASIDECQPSKQIVSRALKAVGIYTTSKKIDNKSQTYLYLSKEDLNQTVITK